MKESSRRKDIVTLLQLFGRLYIPRQPLKTIAWLMICIESFIARKQIAVKTEWWKALWISNNAMYDDSIVLIIFQFFSHFLCDEKKSQLKK